MEQFFFFLLPHRELEIIFKNIITKTDTLPHPDEFPSLKNLRCISVYAHKYTKAGPEVVHYGEKPVVAALVVLNIT